MTGEPSGMLFAIVGPSGAGKDTLINWLRERLSDRPEIMFVRRVITRAPDGSTEDHGTLGEAEFMSAHEAGRFAVVWQAHGLSYGIPKTALDHVSSGGIAICNGSRGALAEIEQAFGPVRVIEITVSPEVLAERLRARGREHESEISQRLARDTPPIPERFAAISIDNSGPVETAGHAILGRIHEYLSAPSAVR